MQKWRFLQTHLVNGCDFLLVDGLCVLTNAKTFWWFEDLNPILFDAFWVWGMNYIPLHFYNPLRKDTRNLLIILLGQHGFILEAQWPILISCILSNFISLVKAYMLGLSIFFHSLMKFFIDWKKRNYLLQTFFL